MRNPGKLLKQTGLSYLLFIGVTLLVLLMSYGLFRFVVYADALETTGFMQFLCALLALLFYPASLALGIALIWVIGQISEQDLRLKWLPLLLCGAALAYYGYRIFSETADAIAFPAFIRPVTDALQQGRDLIGMYLMLFGGALSLTLLFTLQRTLYSLAIPKILGGFACMLIVFTLLMQTVGSSNKNTFFSAIAAPILLFFTYPAFGIITFFLPHIFAQNVGGHMKHFLWLMWLLGGLITLTGLTLVFGNLFFSGALWHFVRNTLHALSYDTQRMLLDVTGFFTGLMLFVQGVAWLIGVIRTTERCPRCGLYDYDKRTIWNRFSDVGSYSAKTERLMHTTQHLLSHDEHYHKYEDRYVTQEKTTTTHHVCRYCEHNFGYTTDTSTVDTLVERRKTGERDERHFL